MEDRLYDNEFEEFLKKQANQHRMYPSDQVWRNIQGEVHGYRKWPALTVIAVFIIAALVVGTVAIKPHTTPIAPQTATITTNKQLNSNAASQSLLADNNGVTKSAYAGHLSVDNITQQTIARANENMLVKESETLLILPAIEASNTNLQVDNISINTKNSDLQEQTVPIVPEKQTLHADLAETNILNAALHSAILPNEKDILRFTPEVSTAPYHFTFASRKEKYPYNITTNNIFTLAFDGSNTMPVTNSPLARISRKSSKLDFQFYITPSISYRRLVDDAEGTLTKSYVTALPYAANYVVDLNQAIQHRPAAGYEIGFSLGYNLGKKFAVRSGFQFNARQYNIDAFVHTSEPATVALSADNSSLVLNTVSGFRNIEGSKPIELKNRYYEIALPIGIDWRPVNKKFAWGIAASVQPTYTFDKEPFIITSNYKNYADGSQLMRNWNINANVETYLGYNTGKYRWQIGPQLRYQFMPTMANSFPIKEYPVDFGIKLGLIRALQ